MTDAVSVVADAGNAVLERGERSPRRRVAYLCLGSAVSAHVTGIIDGLRRLGWEVDYHATNLPGSANRRAWTRRLLDSLLVQVRLWRSGADPDVLYIRHHVAALPTILWARARHVPVVQELNGPYGDPLLGRRVPWAMQRILLVLIRLSVRLSSAVVVVSAGLREIVLKADNPNVYVVPNGADVETFHPRAAADRVIEGSYVIWFGFMGPWQGIDVLLAAAEHRDWPVGVRLLMVGDGPECAKVNAAAERNPRVIHLDRMPQAELAGFAAGSLAGLSPQNHGEGRSLTGLSAIKVFESLACGVPVVVSDFPGHAEFVRRERCGLVVPPDDPGALARAVGLLSREDALRKEMGGRGREVVEAGHSWFQRARLTSEILSSLLETRA